MKKEISQKRETMQLNTEIDAELVKQTKIEAIQQGVRINTVLTVALQHLLSLPASERAKAVKRGTTCSREPPSVIHLQQPIIIPSVVSMNELPVAPVLPAHQHGGPTRHFRAGQQIAGL